MTDWNDIAIAGHPPYNKRVLVCRAVQPITHVFIAQRDWTDKHGEHYIVDGGSDVAAEPTHWAPLLELPKVEAPRPERKA